MNQFDASSSLALKAFPLLKQAIKGKKTDKYKIVIIVAYFTPKVDGENMVGREIPLKVDTTHQKTQLQKKWRIHKKQLQKKKDFRFCL